MFDSRLRHSFSLLSQIREKFGDVLFDTIIHTNVKLKESVVMGQTVVAYDKYCRGTKDYFSLAKEIISKDQLSIEAPAPVIEETVEEAPAEESFRFSSRMQSLVVDGMNGMRMMTFVLDAPEARSVYVTGSFNDWSLDEKCRMHQEGNRWIVDVGLRPGVHKYQFIVDGRWREDPANPRQERNSFGDINSLVEVQSNGNV